MKKFIGRFLIAFIVSGVVIFFFGYLILSSVLGICAFAAMVVAVLTTAFGFHREEIDALEARVKALEERLAEKET